MKHLGTLAVSAILMLSTTAGTYAGNYCSNPDFEGSISNYIPEDWTVLDIGREGAGWIGVYEDYPNYPYALHDVWETNSGVNAQDTTVALWQTVAIPAGTPIQVSADGMATRSVSYGTSRIVVWNRNTAFTPTSGNWTTYDYQTSAFESKTLNAWHRLETTSFDSAGYVTVATLITGCNASDQYIGPRTRFDNVSVSKAAGQTILSFDVGTDPNENRNTEFYNGYDMVADGQAYGDSAISVIQANISADERYDYTQADSEDITVSYSTNDSDPNAPWRYIYQVEDGDGYNPPGGNALTLRGTSPFQHEINRWRIKLTGSSSWSYIKSFKVADTYTGDGQLPLNWRVTIGTAGKSVVASGSLNVGDTFETIETGMTATEARGMVTLELETAGPGSQAWGNLYLDDLEFYEVDLPTDGDTDRDGDVDNFDFGALYGDFTGPISTGTDSNERADLIYYPATGNVILDPEDANGAVITNYVLETDQSFNGPGVAILYPFDDANSSTDTINQISQTDLDMDGFSEYWHLGSILPKHMDLTELQAYLSDATYVGDVGSGVHDLDLLVSGGFFKADFDLDGDVDNVDFGTLYGNYTGPLGVGLDFVAVPGPATLLTLCGASIGLVLKRRRRAARISSAADVGSGASKEQNMGIRKTGFLAVLLAGIVLAGFCGSARAETWKFVCIPDFINIDAPYPSPTFEDTLDYFLDAVAAENPDYVLVPGDLVRGEWGTGREGKTIEQWGDFYYGCWKARMDAHGLNYLVTTGDHELGDEASWWYRDEYENEDQYEQYYDALVDNFDMPTNGPNDFKGTTYYVEHKNTLIVACDVFEPVSDPNVNIEVKFTGEQVTWLDDVLSNSTAEHKIVMAHAPCVYPVRAKGSSQHAVAGFDESPLWTTMVDNDVDVYLAGEVHGISTQSRDGIEQCVCGGPVNTLNYLVATVTDDTISMEYKKINSPWGGVLETPQPAGPADAVILMPSEWTISDGSKAAGMKSVGELVIDKSGATKEITTRTGYFRSANVDNGQFEFAFDDFGNHILRDGMDWQLSDLDEVNNIHKDANDGGSEVPDPPDGSDHWCYMNEDANMYQFLGIVEGNKTYDFTFDIGDRTGHSMPAMTISIWAGDDGRFSSPDVLLDSASVLLPTTNGGTRANSISLDVTGTTYEGGSLWLRFETAATPVGGQILIDNILLDSIHSPEPGTLILLGMGSVALLRRRRLGCK